MFSRESTREIALKARDTVESTTAQLTRHLQECADARLEQNKWLKRLILAMGAGGAGVLWDILRLHGVIH